MNTCENFMLSNFELFVFENRFRSIYLKMSYEFRYINAFYSKLRDFYIYLFYYGSPCRSEIGVHVYYISNCRTYNILFLYEENNVEWLPWYLFLLWSVTLRGMTPSLLTIHFPNYLDSEQNKIGYAVKNLMRRNMIELLSKRLMCLFRIRPRRLSKFIFASNDKRYQPLPCL